MPVEIPAEAVEEIVKELATVDMKHGAFAGEESVGLAEASSGEAVGGLMSFATGAMAGDEKTGIDDGADERDAFVGELFAALMGMESEVEILGEEMIDNVDIADELVFLREGNDNEKVVDVATVMLVAEVHSDEAVELVEEDIRNELTSKIADDDAVAGLAIEKTLMRRESVPIFFRAADGDAGHRVVIDNLMPEKLHSMIETLAIAGCAEDVIASEIVRRECGDGRIEAELAIETPADALE